MNETKRKKYNNLKNDLSIIESKLNDLSTQYNKMNNDLKKGINIDSKVIEEEKIIEIKKINNNILSEINNIIKPIINNNIF